MAASELSYNILNRSMESHVDEFDVTVFWVYLNKGCVNSLCSNHHISDGYYWDGPMIATCLETAHKLLNFPTCPFKMFFIEDLEWLRMPQKNYHELEQIYRNPSLTLLCRSDDHKKVIENAWNVKVEKVIHNYDFFNPNFLNYVKSKSKNLYDERSKYFNPKMLNSNSLNI